MKTRKISIVFLALMGFVIVPVMGSSQEQERIIDKISWRTEPIKIVKLKTKGKAIELGKAFSEEDDWLTGLTVTVENTSNKAIARIELQLAFPGPGRGSSTETPIYSAGMGYGKEPSDVAPDEVMKLVLPGERVDIRLLEINLPFIKAALQKLGYGEKIAQGRLMVSSVTFVDGSEWRGDEMLYPDPNNPKKKINPKYQLDAKGTGRLKAVTRAVETSP